MMKTQQNTILDQRIKLSLQEEVIEAMKMRLKAILETAWDQAEIDAADPSMLCRKVHEVSIGAIL